MKQEKLFLALADIGDDLIERAETRRYSNSGWKKWVSLAASVVLVLCLGTLVLPALPIGCGSEGAPLAETDSSVYESIADDMKDEFVADDYEAVPEEAPAEQPETVTEDGMKEEAAPEAEEQLLLVIGGQQYAVEEWPELEISRADLGEPFGTVTAAFEEDLIGCSAYAYEDGLVVVIASDRWILCRALADNPK